MYSKKDVQNVFTQLVENNLLIFHKESCKKDVAIPGIFFIPLVFKMSEALNLKLNILPIPKSFNFKQFVDLYYEEYLKTQDYPI